MISDPEEVSSYNFNNAICPRLQRRLRASLPGGSLGSSVPALLLSLINRFTDELGEAVHLRR